MALVAYENSDSSEYEDEENTIAQVKNEDSKQ